jgi:hypothetical protein
MVTKDAVISGFKYFKMKNLKGRPNINTNEEYNDMIDIWCESLQDVRPDIFIVACKMLSDELTFYPSFAEVRKRCDELTHGKKETAMEVWNKYSSKMISVHGAYSNAEDSERLYKSIECPVVVETCRAFDWRAYGGSNESQELFYFREFEKIYNAVIERQSFNKSADRALIGTNKNVKDLLTNTTKRIE